MVEQTVTPRAQVTGAGGSLSSEKARTMSGDHVNQTNKVVSCGSPETDWEVTGNLLNILPA